MPDIKVLSLDTIFTELAFFVYNHRILRYLKTIFVTFVCVIGVLPQVNAQTPPELINDQEFRPAARQAIDSLYNFNQPAADSLLAPWKQRHPDHPLWTLFDGMELWWQILADLEDTSHDEKFFNLMGRADYQASQLLRKKQDHADALIIKAIANGYIARQHANRERWITSVNQARKAHNAYQYLQEVQPNLPDLKMAEGLKLYYAEYLPEEYPIVKTVSWFLPDGDKQNGLQFLREAANQSIFAQAEARYFLGNINLLYEDNYQEATRHLTQLYKTYPNNNYYARILVRSLFEMNEYERALQIIDESITRWEQQNSSFQPVLKEELLTWRGRILYRNFQYQEAAEAFQKAFETGRQLQDPEARSQHVISGYYLGRSHLQMGNNAEARRYLETVADMEAQENYRDEARRLLRENF